MIVRKCCGFGRSGREAAANMLPSQMSCEDAADFHTGHHDNDSCGVSLKLSVLKDRLNTDE